MADKVITNISHDKVADQVQATENMIEGLTGNTDFANPVISLTTVKNDNDALITKEAVSIHGGDLEILARNIAREVVVSNYRAIANWVNSIAKGDRQKLLSTKMRLAKKGEKTTPPDQELLSSNVSGVVVYYNRISPKGLIAKLIQVTYTPAVESSWVLIAVTRKQKKVITNCTVEKRIWVRCAVVIIEDAVEFGEPISVLVN